MTPPIPRPRAYRSQPAVFCLFLLVFVLSLAPVQASNRVQIPVTVNGQVMRFGFDTGAGVGLVLWSDVARMIGLPFAPPSSDPAAPGQVRVSFSDPAEVMLLGQKIPNASFAVVDAPDYAKWEFQGLVGWPAVRDNIWRIEPGQRGLSTLAQVPPEAKEWLKYRLAEVDNTLALQIPLHEGKTGILVIDTGDSGGVSLAPALWEKWKAEHPNAPTSLEANEMLATGVATTEMSVAPQWSLDRLTLTQVIVQQAHPSAVAAGGPDYIATLGFDALRKLTLIVDAKSGWAYLRPHEEVSSPGTYNRLGAVFTYNQSLDTKSLSARVVAGGPAASAGLRDGDRLLRLNGIPIEHWRGRPGTWPLAAFFEQTDGTQLDLAIDRDGKSLEVKPVLRSLLEPALPPAPQTFTAPPPLEFHLLPPFAALTAQAEKVGLSTRTNPQTGVEGPMQTSDSVTALITCSDDNQLEQWLVLFVGNDLKPAEKKAKRALPVLYSVSGQEFRFDPTPCAVAIHLIGPVKAAQNGKPAHDEWSGAIVTRDFLAMGFDSTALAMQKFEAAPSAHFGFAFQPFPAKDAATARAQLEAIGISAADERAFVGGVMAVSDYFQLAAQTPGIRDVLRQMLGLSWKDLLKNPKLNIDIEGPVENLPPEFWGLPAGEPCRSFRFRIDLNDVPRLFCRVVVTRPLRPMQTVAGIVGIAASRVDGSGPHVMVRILSSHLAKSPGKN